MKFTRKAIAKWQGSGLEGKGNLTTQSTVLNNTAYSFKTRFENEIGTNPEELIAAAHAGCFTMQLSFLLDEAGYTADILETEAKLTFENKNITTIELFLKGKVNKISPATFKDIAENAKEVCPVSKLLNAKIELTTQLI